MRPRKASFLLLFSLLLATSVAGATALAAGKPGVAASFTFSPTAPVSGDLITFRSTSVTTGNGNSLTARTGTSTVTVV